MARSSGLKDRLRRSRKSGSADAALDQDDGGTAYRARDAGGARPSEQGAVVASAPPPLAAGADDRNGATLPFAVAPRRGWTSPKVASRHCHHGSFEDQTWRLAMLVGSCLCGSVRYECGDLASPIGLCHCRTCQKAHSSAYAPTARADRANFKWTAGANIVLAFESTPGKRRWFCPKCGTHLMAEWKDQDQVIVRIGSLDTTLEEKPVVHIWMSHASPMIEAPLGIPTYPEGVPPQRR